MKNLTRKPFDFTEAYFRKEKHEQLATLQKLKEVSPSMRKELVVDTNGLSAVFKLESDGEYYDKRGASLTSQLQLLAKVGRSKVSIYERK